MRRYRSHSTTARSRVLLAVLLALVGSTGAVTAVASGPKEDGLLIVAEFADASPLLVGSDVKVSGVTVGRTVSMDVAGNAARVGLELEPTALPVYDDAKAIIRPVSLLGERYVDLERGGPQGQVLRDGDVIKKANTGTNVDLDEVLNTLDEPTAESLSVLVTALGHGVQGNGSNVAKAIRALEPAMSDADGLARVLGEQNQLLTSLVDHVTPVVEGLAHDNGKTVDELVASTERVLGEVARRQRELDEAVAEAPGTVEVARTTLGKLTAAAREAVPTLEALRPTTDNLRTISSELERFATSANTALDKADPLLEKADEMLRKARPVVATLRQAGPNLKQVSADAAPIVEQLSVHIDDVVNALGNWALTTNGRDGLSHYFRGLVVVSPETVTSLLPTGTRQGPNPDERQSSPLPLPGLIPGLDGSGEPLDGLLSPDTSGSDGGVTGLDPAQERGLLGLILGGE